MTAEQIYTNNQRLVTFVYNKYFSSNPANELIKDELLAEGRCGLWRAASHFEESRNVQFSTYGVHCIYDSMLMFVTRKHKKTIKDISMNTCLAIDRDGSELTYEDVLAAPDSFGYIELKLTIEKLLKIYSELAPCVKLHLQGYKQEFIASKLGVSQPHVSRLFKRFKKLLQAELKIN